MQIEYNRLTMQTPKCSKKYNSKRKEDATVNILTMKASPQFTLDIVPKEVCLFEGTEKTIRIVMRAKSSSKCNTS